MHGCPFQSKDVQSLQVMALVNHGGDYVVSSSSSISSGQMLSQAHKPLVHISMVTKCDWAASGVLLESAYKAVEPIILKAIGPSILDWTAYHCW